MFSLLSYLTNVNACAESNQKRCFSKCTKATWKGHRLNFVTKSITRQNNSLIGYEFPTINTISICLNGLIRAIGKLLLTKSDGI